MNEKREEQPSPVTIFSVGGPLKTYCDFHSHDSFLSHCLNSLLQPWNPVELETGTMNIVYIVWKWWNCEKSRWFQWSIYIKCCSDQSHKGGNFEDVVSIMLNYSKKTTKQTLSETFITSRLVDNSDSLGQNFCTCPCEKILQKSSKGPLYEITTFSAFVRVVPLRFGIDFNAFCVDWKKHVSFKYDFKY